MNEQQVLELTHSESFQTDAVPSFNKNSIQTDWSTTYNMNQITIYKAKRKVAFPSVSLK